MGGREPSTQAVRDKRGTGNLGRASLLTKAFHLSLRFPPRQCASSSGILLSTYLIRKLFFLPFRECIKEKYPPPTHIYTHPSAVKTLSSL